jgi:hypothetical protein
MPAVISLAGWKAENSPHLSGKAHCMACGHEGVSVAPVGTVWMECPACHGEKSLFTHGVEYPGKHWACACGNQFFHITPEGVYCPNCGDWQVGF